MVRSASPHRPLLRLALCTVVGVLASLLGPAETAAAASTTLRFAPEADARVEKNNSKRNFGTSSTLSADNSPLMESYLRFTVAGVVGPVQQALLRLWVSNGSKDGPAVYPSALNWSERGVTWSTKPARSGAPVDDKAVVAENAWAEFDVTPLVAGGNGTYSFALVATSTDGAGFGSREARNRPELVVLTGEAPPPPDTTPPDTSIDSGPSGTVPETSASFGFSSDESANFECSLDGGAYAACTSPAGYDSLADGAHRFAVRAIDPAGNVDPSPATRDWVVRRPDTRPPDTFIDSGPSGTVAETSATFTFSSDEAGATFQCSLDWVIYSACTSPITYDGLANGEHWFHVRAFDAAGNWDASAANQVWTVRRFVPASPRDALLAPASGAHFGVHHKMPSGLTLDGKKAELDNLEAALGRRMAIDSFYEPWGSYFPDWREPFAFSRGRIPMINWGKTYTSDVNFGFHDDYIRARADGIRSLGRPVFLRWFWEMDGSRNAGLAGSPTDYIAAWRRIRTIFDQQGATNVAWVWCPNASGFATGRAQSFYPGDEWVDWVCADGYNFYPDPGHAYKSFLEKFAVFNDWAVQRGKPAMAGEYGAQYLGVGERARWINEAREALKTRLTAMLAVVYFHSVTSEHDWQLTWEPDAFEAFRQMGLDPYFNP